MDFDLPPDDDQRRLAVREWLAANPSPSGRALAEAGYVAPHWPRPWGLEADPIEQIVIDQELAAAGVHRPPNQIGIGWAGPTLLAAGSQEQKDRYLFPILAGEEYWCQLFSEPGAGSDLASLRTTAVRDGDHYVVNGSKVWTSIAHVSKFGILIARTDPDAPKQRGISYFICPMDDPGVEVRPIVEMTGVHLFNEVFLDEVRIPVENLVGEENRGWDLAKVTLANERVSLSSGGALWGRGPSASDLVDLAKEHGVDDPELRQRVAQIHIEGELLRLLRLRTVTAAIQGTQPGPEASIRKVFADEHGQRLMTLALDLAGSGGLVDDIGPFGSGADMWRYGFLFGPALTIGGGTAEVQRNIIGERVLGLPAEPVLDR